MKISVLGAGAIGSMLGGLIRYHDPAVELVLISRGAHGQAMRERGKLTLQGPWEDRTVDVTATDDMAAIAGSDHVLVTVKSQGTEQAIAAAAPFLAGAIVTSVQNGFSDNVLLQHVDPARLVMGITATNVTIPSPGTASLQFPGTLVVGPRPDGANRSAAGDVADVLGKTGFQVYQNDQIEGVRYNKLCINSPGYAASLSQTNFIADGVCNTPWRRAVGLPLVQECLDVFDAAGIPLVSIPKLPDIQKLRKFFRLLDNPIAGPVVRVGAKAIYNRRPIQFSLEQDLRRGNGTEVDYTIGEIVRVARAAGVDAPRNQLIIDLAKEIESRGAGQFMTRQEVVDRFAAIDR